MSFWRCWRGEGIRTVQMAPENSFKLKHWCGLLAENALKGPPNGVLRGHVLGIPRIYITQ